MIGPKNIRKRSKQNVSKRSSLSIGEEVKEAEVSGINNRIFNFRDRLRQGIFTGSDRVSRESQNDLVGGVVRIEEEKEEENFEPEILNAVIPENDSSAGTSETVSSYESEEVFLSDDSDDEEEENQLEIA